MVRILSAAAVLASALTLGTAANAQSAYYAAVPIAKPTKTSFIARETVWTWRDAGFTARRGADRDAVQCELVARQTGKLSAFTAGGAAFDTAALEKCNAKAK